MSNNLIYPARDLGELFHDVQLSGIFPDSKTFSDALCTLPPKEVLTLYQQEKNNSDFKLIDFVLRYFKIRKIVDDTSIITSKNIDTHIKGLWHQLKREDKAINIFSSKIQLPQPYVVPGGRFDEIYYWDSYFTMLGLIACDEHRLALDMYRNFEFILDSFGFIPNGNRSYYLSRSQPPFFSLMARLMIDEGLIKIDEKLLSLLVKEYSFWKEKSLDFSYGRDRHIHMFRYFDASKTPRDESYAEDLEIFEATKNENIYCHIRSACESGWDFSSRWFANKKSINSIRTADIFPIDLNCLMTYMEAQLASIYEDLGHVNEAEKYKRWSEERIEVIQSIFFDGQKGFFDDIDHKGKKLGNSTLAGIFPMFLGYANPIQSQQCSEFIEKTFLSDGGVVTSDVTSGQQWDAPNGWAPLQLMTAEGLERYGYIELAHTIMDRWCKTVENEFEKSGKLMEKYNVVTPNIKGGGGEYPNQDGFGWTNSVYVVFKNKLKNN